MIKYIIILRVYFYIPNSIKVIDMENIIAVMVKTIINLMKTFIPD